MHNIGELAGLRNAMELETYWLCFFEDTEMSSFNVSDFDIALDMQQLFEYELGDACYIECEKLLRIEF